MHIFKAEIFILILLSVFAAYDTGSLGIDCFKCASMNGSLPACDDPFHNNNSVKIYETPCMAGRKGRNGLFPATSCLKLSGWFELNYRITIRGCALDSGTLTTDTEIVRSSHCGSFYFDGKRITGCLMSCNDADACNATSTVGGCIELIMAGVIYIFWTTFIKRPGLLPGKKQRPRKFN